MTKNELVRIFDDIADAYPRFNTSDGAVRIWFEHIGGFSARNVKAAVSRWIANSSHSPTIADIRQTVQAIYGKKEVGVGEWLPSYRKIDFCMDMLGPKLVNDELRLLAGITDDAHPGITALKLCAQKDWVPKYKAKLAEMLACARNAWDEGIRPDHQWINGGAHQRLWSMHHIPEFDDMHFAKRKNEQPGARF